MSPKTLVPLAAAVSTVLLNLALVTPANAQKAALTRDVDRPSAQPVTGSCNTNTNIPCILYSVPAGKRLTVETVSYIATVPSAQGLIKNIVFGQNASPFYPSTGPNIYSVAPVLTYVAYGTRTYNAAQPLRAYIEENQTLAGAVYADFSTGYQQTLIFSGYLVDK